jgi:hypothetical protein
VDQAAAVQITEQRAAVELLAKEMQAELEYQVCQDHNVLEAVVGVVVAPVRLDLPVAVAVLVR